MRFLSSTDVGLKALLYMTACGREIVQQHEIGQCFNIKTPAVKRPLLALTEGGIITSHRGRYGGFSLKRAPKTVTLEEVVKLLEPDFHLIPSLAPLENGKARCPNATFHFAFDRALKAFFHELSDFTIAELAGDPYSLNMLGIPDPRKEQT